MTGSGHRVKSIPVGLGLGSKVQSRFHYLVCFARRADELMPDFERIRVLLHSDGRLHWEPGGIFRTTCDINIAYFPFDSQRCPLLIGAYSYHSTRMNITNTSCVISTHDFRVNGEWHVISTSAEWGLTILSPPGAPSAQPPTPLPDDAAETNRCAKSAPFPPLPPPRSRLYHSVKVQTSRAKYHFIKLPRTEAGSFPYKESEQSNKNAYSGRTFC